MKKMNGTVFLGFFVVIIVILCVAVVWIAQQLGAQLATGLGIGIFLVLILFAQQILTGIQINDNTQNLDEYDNNQAKVEEKRMQAQVVYAQAMRETAKVQNKIDEAQYNQMRIAAQKMANLLTDTEVAKIKAEMMGMGMLTDSSQTIELE